MALISFPTDHFKLKKMISFEKKPLMLKDFLLRDDLSSCSSHSFKSFPRQHCCTTVRFLLETELKKSKDNYSTTKKRLLKRSRKKPGGTTVSALQRASEAVLNAVKLLPFPSIKSSSPSLKKNSTRKVHFTRSFSRNIFKRSFWRKADKEDGGGGGEIKSCKLFREFLEEKNQPLDQITIGNVNTNTYAGTCMTTSRVSSNTSSNSWAESEFTEDVLQSSSGNSESSSENDVVASNVVGVTAGEDSINFTGEQDWRNEEGKEQFSPVSVLDFPFDDVSHFEDGSPYVEGRKQKVPRFQSLAQLQPVDLQKRIAMTELEENDKLLKLLKTKIPSQIFKFMDDNLLLDFFRETLTVDDDKAEEELYMEFEDCINGDCEDVFVGWETQEGRKAYLKEMERKENWRNFKEEEEGVGSALELEVFSSLVDELLTELFLFLYQGLRHDDDDSRWFSSFKSSEFE
ncbi:Detected protein of unknown function [Hibiscus syriacus]|uniref:Uncharacterized protein n=1 Tax=Hibiscus syriacus TaxID=106335 RepID=A0A6A2ZTJ7_HIBSY|nr:Detected protein of unknown function [Hibiscus syriacus]